MPAWALRVVAILITGLSMIGSTTYALADPKNPNAPLQPPVVDKGSAEPSSEDSAAPAPFRTLAPTVPPTPSPTATPRTSGTVASTLARGTATPTRTAAPTLRPTPVPQITLAAGVRATALPKVTYTHSS